MKTSVKRLISMLLCAVLLVSIGTVQTFADEGKNDNVVPSVTVNGDIQNMTSPGNVASPNAFIGYQYVPGYERLTNRTFDYKYGYIYGTSLYFSDGATLTYTMTVKRSSTKSTNWNVKADFEGEFSMSLAKARVMASGGYSSTNTATVEIGETWTAQMNVSGVYDLAWYMRGHKYYAQCGSRIMSTGADDGQFMYYTLGTVTFPTDEVYFEAVRNDTY